MLESISSLPSGKYLVVIQSIEYELNVVKYRYEISVGPFVGFGANCMKARGSYPLFNRFVLPKGYNALISFLKAVDVPIPPNGLPLENQAATNALIQKAVGKRLWVDLEVNGCFISVRHHDSLSSSPILPSDISIGNGPWNNGSEVFSRATALACYSGLPRIFVDVREKGSPMINWCQEHQIIPVPQFFHAGDYTSPESNNVVDRKSGILELYADFSNPDRYGSYCTAAQMAALMGKKLIYVIATRPEDSVTSVADLKNWSTIIPGKNKIIDGASTCRNISLYQEYFSNTDFVFVPENQQCQMIYDLLINQI